MYAVVVVVNKFQHKKVVSIATVRENSSNFSLTDDDRNEGRNIISFLRGMYYVLE